MNMYELLTRHRRVENGVALGGHFAKPRSDHKKQIGILEALYQGGRAGSAEIAGKIRRSVVVNILASERGRHRKAVGLGESPQPFASAVTPARTPDQHHRPFRL